MSALDPRLEVIREKYGLDPSAFWELPQKKGTWIAKHADLEVVAVKAGIEFDNPQIIEAATESGIAVLSVRGMMWVGDKESDLEEVQRWEWSVGEASPKNNKNAYPWAMAEKRAKDRVILKLIGIHGLAYSEDEADDFRPDKHVDAPEPVKSAPKALMRPIDGEMRKEIEACQTVEELTILWRSGPFKTEYERLPKDWKEALVEFMAETKANLVKSPPHNGYVAPRFNEGRGP